MLWFPSPKVWRPSRLFSRHYRQYPHGITVFPGAGHGLFTEVPDPAIDRASQLAPGFIPMVQAFIHENTSTTVDDYSS